MWRERILKNRGHPGRGDAACYGLDRALQKPLAVYYNRKNAFVLDCEPTIDVQHRGITPQSPFEVACARLGIEVIIARSPEAKDRDERNHAVYQDCFVKELKLAGISSITRANSFLEKTYLPVINAKFERTLRHPRVLTSRLWIQPSSRTSSVFKKALKDFVTISSNTVDNPQSRSALVHIIAAIDVHCFAVDKRGFVGGEEHH